MNSFKKYQLLEQGQKVIVYRGIHESGVNFNQSGSELPFKYYSLTKSKAKMYGKLNEYIFNGQQLPIKIFKGYELFNKFGLDASAEDNEVIKTLISEGYSAVIIKGDELIVYEDSLISNS